MVYADLSPYEYCLPIALPDVLNVGWLDGSSSFSRGVVSPRLLEKLTAMLDAWPAGAGFFDARFNLVRGGHACAVCGMSGFHNPYVGACELLVPDREAGHYFVAPSLVVHYLSEHAYQPPAGFVDAVMRVDMQRPFDAQAIYDALVATQPPD